MGENESSKCPDHHFSFIFISVHKSQKFLSFLKAKKSTVPRLVSRLRDNKEAALASSLHSPSKPILLEFSQVEDKQLFDPHMDISLGNLMRG